MDILIASFILEIFLIFILIILLFLAPSSRQESVSPRKDLEEIKNQIYS